METLEITSALLIELVENKNTKLIREIFDEHNIVDLAECVAEMDVDKIMFIFKILRKEVSGELFSYLPNEIQTQIIELFTNNEVQKILENMYSDDVIEIMEDLPANLVKKVLSAASKEQREELNTLLSYEPNTAGYIMSTDFVELKVNDTMEQAIKRIKKQGKIAETISNCYVVDEKRRLVGTIALRDILFEDSDAVICDYMDKDVIYARTTEDQEEVARIAARYDLLVVPVVNDEYRLIGIITVDDIIDVIEEETTEDIQKMAAIVPVEDSYIKSSIFTLAKSRLPWLCALMITATLTGGLLSRFEDALAVVPVLSSFVPMIMGTAGNAGSQASTMVIRGISVDGLNKKNTLDVIFKELRVGLVCGAILFGVVLIRMMVLPPAMDITTAIVIGLSMVIALIVAKVAGGVLPILADALHQDPAAMAAPIITTIVDTLSLIIYFSLAMALLHI